jgi:hypothetical protein
MIYWDGIQNFSYHKSMYYLMHTMFSHGHGEHGSTATDKQQNTNNHNHFNRIAAPNGRKLAHFYMDGWIL